MKLSLVCVVALSMLVFLTARAREAAAHPSPAAATTLKHDFGRCHEHADVDACYDAIRYNPNDPALLVALGDALLRAHRPADALRNYQRAASLAPNMKTLPAKITAAQARLHPKRLQSSRHIDGTRVADVPGHYSNAAPEAQSH